MGHLTVRSAGPVHRIERFQSLQPGYYWRARRAIPEEGIEEGTVLLLQSLRYAEDVPHTVILRPHPTKIGTNANLEVPQADGSIKKIYFRYDEHRFLVKDFLAAFEFEPDADSVRDEEVQAVQNRIGRLQSELIEAQHDPSHLAGYIEAGLQEAVDSEEAGQDQDEVHSKPRPQSAKDAQLPATASPAEGIVTLARGSLAQALGAGINADLVTRLKAATKREHQIATLKANWIKEKTAEIAKTIAALTPFFEEKAAAALAQTEDVRAYVDKLMRGIGTLDLYLGKDVVVETIKEGAAAAADIPLTLVQRKLLMDEELARWEDVHESFDFSRDDLFLDALRQHSGLVQQIFPTERCVLVMATTHRHIDYGDPWVNVIKGSENRKVFLLVRNGENIHRVYSPVESHLGAARLFPSKGEQDQIFRGFDGREIKFEDIAYTDKLSAHEKHALHYKRFLILLCGLDHRLKLFGDFYPGPSSLEFVSLDFQAQHLRFLFDAGEHVLGQDRMPLREWIKEKNRYLRSGSRVLCHWPEAITPETAPSVCKKDYGQHGSSFHRYYEAEEKFGLAIARKEGTSLIVQASVTGYSHRARKDRTFNCKVNLSRYESQYGDRVAYLCLDAVRPEEILGYLNHRESRSDHLFYIRFFKSALKILEAERAQERQTRELLVAALAQGEIAKGQQALEIIDQAVIAWRAANGGKALPSATEQGTPAWTALLNQLYVLARKGQGLIEEVSLFAKKLGLAPLRLVVSGAAKHVLYVAPTVLEQDNRLEEHAWVHRLVLDQTKGGFRVKAQRWATLPAASASETTLHEWPEAGLWGKKRSVFSSYGEKQEFLEFTGSFSERLAPFSGPLSSQEFHKQLAAWSEARRRAMSKSAYVENPSLAIPFGVVRHFGREGSPWYICVGSHSPHALLYRLAPGETERQLLRKEFCAPYLHQKNAEERLLSEVQASSQFSLMLVAASLRETAIEGYFSCERGTPASRLPDEPTPDPRLGSWYAAWRKDLSEKTSVWITEGALDSAGELTLDGLLGITLPADYEPTHVLEIECFDANRGAPTTYKHWFDIFKDDVEASECHPETGHRSGTHESSSPQAARDWVLEKAASAVRKGARLVRAAELPEAPPAPAGVERWYLLSGNAGEEPEEVS